MLTAPERLDLKTTISMASENEKADKQIKCYYVMYGNNHVIFWLKFRQTCLKNY